jgi:long-chain acyl-CoA synthetase
MAAESLGLVVVPLYLRDSPDNQSFVLGHSGARLLVIDDLGRWQALAPRRHLFPGLEQVWIEHRQLPDANPRACPRVRTLSQAIPEQPDRVSLPKRDPNRLATIIYTSGTTGRPKGVMLTNRALLWNAEAVTRVVLPSSRDIFLSCLPLAHAFERVVGYYLPVMAGATVAYARSVDTLAEDFRAIRPTAFLGVPRLYERAHAAVQGRMSHAVARRVLRMAADVGWQRFEAAQGRRPGPSLWARLSWPLLDRLAGHPVRAAFGGRVRCAVSGGAPLPVEVARLFNALGVPIVEGYGLTEAGPVVAANSLEDNLPGSIGRPLPGIAARSTDRGELLVRTPSVMAGYWQEPDLTAQVIDRDGWLHTDDIVEFVGGRMFLKGRFKEVVALATGEKFAPGLIENRITKDRLFRQALVVGEHRPFAAAIVVLDRERWMSVVAREGLALADPNAAPACGHLLGRIALALRGLPHHAQIRAVHATFEPWTVETGQLTPTLKAKRDRLEQQYRADIERLYADHARYGVAP